jgi:hypothetical protein
LTILRRQLMRWANAKRHGIELFDLCLIRHRTYRP